MTLSRTLIGITLAVVMAASAASVEADDTTGVELAFKQFYVALNAMFEGDVEPMKTVWSHGDDVVYMGPMGGMQVGWDEVLEQWKQQAAMKLGGKIEPRDVRMTVARDLALVNNYEVGHNLDADGNRVEVSLRVTKTFRLENGQWKLIAVHTDKLPFLDR